METSFRRSVLRSAAMAAAAGAASLGAASGLRWAPPVIMPTIHPPPPMSGERDVEDGLVMIDSSGMSHDIVHVVQWPSGVVLTYEQADALPDNVWKVHGQSPNGGTSDPNKAILVIKEDTGGGPGGDAATMPSVADLKLADAKTVLDLQSIKHDLVSFVYIDGGTSKVFSWDTIDTAVGSTCCYVAEQEPEHGASIESDSVITLVLKPSPCPSASVIAPRTIIFFAFGFLAGLLIAILLVRRS